MQKAKAQYPERVVRASDAGAPRYATCGSCGGEVVLRRGLQRRSHYAHLPGEGTDACENYFGFDENDHNPPTIRRHLVQKGKRESTFYHSGGLYIEFGMNGRPELILKMPTPEETYSWDGNFVIFTPEGERSLSFRNLRKPQFLRLRIQPQPLSYRIDGNVSKAYLSRLESDAFRLLDAGNIFRWSVNAGRLLAPRSELYWGERYWLLSRSPPAKPTLDAAYSEIEHTYVLGEGWSLYEIQLPPSSANVESFVRQGLLNLFGREICDPPPRVILWSPQPHHIDQDGVYIIPSECNEIKLWRNDDLWIDAYMQDGTRLDVFEHEDEYVTVSGLQDGLITIYFDERVAFELVREPCKLFEPVSMGFNWNGQVRDLFEADAVIATLPTTTPLPFIVANDMLLSAIKLNGRTINSCADVDQAVAVTVRPNGARHFRRNGATLGLRNSGFERV